MKRRLTDIHKILVVTLSNLGDVVLTLPVFQSLGQAFPGAELHALVGAAGREVLEENRRIRKIILYDKKMPWPRKFRFLFAVRREKYDLIVDLRRSLIGLLGGARYRNPYLGFTKEPVHRVQKHLFSLRNLVGKDIYSPPYQGGVARESNASGRLVVAAVGSKSDIKKWPPEKFACLLDRLVFQDDCRVILVGDKSDVADATRVRGLMKAPVEDFCGRTNFRELAGILKTAALVITHDSAPLHIADSLGTPVLAIFGPTDPRKYGPRLGASQGVRRTLFCSPCEKAQCRYSHECMKELTVDEIHRAALRILSDEDEPRGLKILVIRLDRIGDVVLSLPAVEALKARFPNSKISVMTRPYAREIVEGHPSVDEVIPYFYESRGRHRWPLGYGRFIREIIERRFDVAFVLHPSTRSFLVPFLAGIPYRVGLEQAGSPFSFCLTQPVPDYRHEGSKHESEYALDVIRAFGAPSARGKKTSIPVFAEHRARVDGILEGAGWGPEETIIAFHAGASCPSKRWPKERFAELGNRVLKELPHRIVIVGGEEERSLGEFLTRAIADVGAHGRAPLLDLTGQLTLKELAAFLRRCKLLVTNDSGPAHIAAAVSCSTLCIFGRNQAGLSVRRWKALGQGHRVIQKDVGCVVCLAHRCSIGFECLKAISVDEVFENVREMLVNEPIHVS